jgi:hypothetical protein
MGRRSSRRHHHDQRVTASATLAWNGAVAISVVGVPYQIVNLLPMRPFGQTMQTKGMGSIVAWMTAHGVYLAASVTRHGLQAATQYEDE